MADEALRLRIAHRHRPRRWLLIATTTAILCAGLGLRDAWPPDEPRFALIAKEILASGDWLLLSRGGELYSDKPPLFVWFQAVLLLLTGSWRGAFLLPSALAAAGTLFFVYDLARRLWGERAAWWAGITLLLSVQFTLQAKSAQIDAFLCFWTTLGLYGLARHLLIGPSWTWYTIAGAAMGAGIMTKGVGFLPLLFLLPWLLHPQSCR